MSNNSKIPETQSYLPNTKLPSIIIKSQDISNLIRSLNVNSTNGYDNISIRMTEPLTIVFNACINQTVFSDIWQNQIYVLFIKMTNKLSIITSQYHYYQCLGRYLKD